ncbi:MAG: hypothetical protein PHU05_04190 [Bacilli bacterium]|nr:hypothetical protein [Bacilli bacterium]
MLKLGTELKALIEEELRSEKITVNGITGAQSFTNAGNKTISIDLSSYGFSEITSAQVSSVCTYVDNQYMEKHACYVHSVTTTLLKIALVNGYPSSIGYYIYYTVTGT